MVVMVRCTDVTPTSGKSALCDVVARMTGSGDDAQRVRGSRQAEQPRAAGVHVREHAKRVGVERDDLHAPSRA